MRHSLSKQNQFDLWKIQFPFYSRNINLIAETKPRHSCNACGTISCFMSRKVGGYRVNSSVKSIFWSGIIVSSPFLSSADNAAQPFAFFQHDLVYTFFEPILRDEEKDSQPSLKSPSAVGGEIKVSLHYKNNALYIMVMHCRNLVG